MDPTLINWSRRLAELISHASDIPTDITFKFVKANDGNGEVFAQSNDSDGEVSAQSNDSDGEVSAQSNESDGEVSAQSNDSDGEVSALSNHGDNDVSAQTNDEDEVSAHKMILAVVSPMLRKMFYVHNTVDMFAQEIIMDDTTAPAFRIFIDAIYGVTHIQESLKGKSVDEMFAVLYLVTKYDIPELVRAVQDTLTCFPLSMDTVLEVAGDVMDYAATFQEETNQLLLTCAKFMKANLTHANDVLGFIAENGDKMAVIHKLSVLIREITPVFGVSISYGFPEASVMRFSRGLSVLDVNGDIPGLLPDLVESSEEESENEESDEEVGDGDDSCGDSCHCLTSDSEDSDEENEDVSNSAFSGNLMEAAIFCRVLQK